MSLKLERHEDHAVLSLAAPPSNLLDGDMLSAMESALNVLAATEVPPLLLRAEGRHFSTGYPVDAIPEAIFHADPARRAEAPFERVMITLASYPAPVLAAVQGDAYGGAVELLCCADLRVGVHDIRFAVPAARLGLIYSPSGIRRFQAAFGASLTREMLLTGEPVSARRAFRGGFLNRLVSPDCLDDACAMLLGSLVKGGPLALRGMRRTLKLIEEAEPLGPEALAEIADLRHAAWCSDDFKEAQQAFLEKRRPVFKGR